MQIRNWPTTNPRCSVYVLLVTFFAAGLLLSGYRTGPGGGGLARTGAPFVANGLYCTECHGGGNFGASITVELIDAASNIVAIYNPAESYSLRITLGHTTGLPKFGFQVMAVTANDEKDLNNWGTVPSRTHSVAVGGRHYVEHSNPLTNNVIIIPFTAPFANSGPIAFYAAGNIVNGTGGTDDDQPVKTVLTITENKSLPVRLLSFKGEIRNNLPRLTWETTSEVGIMNYVVDKSLDGRRFETVATISPKNSQHANYTFVDQHFNDASYYRLRAVDLDGKFTMFNTVKLTKASADDYHIIFYSHGNFNRILFTNQEKEQKIKVHLSDMAGRQLYKTEANAVIGSNSIPIPATIGKGVLLITIITENGRHITLKTIAR